jgi:hypothetical protein
MLRAFWRVLHADGEASFITSNLGFAPFALGSVEGVVIPISRAVVVHLQPRPRLQRLVIRTDRWLVDVEALSVTSRLANAINAEIARYAPNEIYGPDRCDVAAHGAVLRAEAAQLPRLIWDHAAVLRRNELELLRFLQMIASPAEGPVLTEEEAWKAIDYPAALFFRTRADNGLTDEEEAAIAQAQEAEAALEGQRLARLMGGSEAEGVVRTIDPFRGSHVSLRRLQRPARRRPPGRG